MPPITLTGEGEMNSAKTALRGDYAVDWKTLGDCYYSADLRAKETSLDAKTVFTAAKAGSGTGNVYGLNADDYFLKVITGPSPDCGWSVTLTPLP